MRTEGRRATRRAAALAALLLAGSAAARAADRPAAGAPTEEAARAIEEHLMCYCGCTDLTVRVCNCGVAAGIKDDIRDRLAKGQSPDEVEAAYVARYGEQIRSAPTRSGFNLLAWIMPFAVVFAAGAAIVVLVRRWGMRPFAAAAAPAGATAPAGTDPAGVPGPDRAALERVDRAVRDLL